LSVILGLKVSVEAMYSVTTYNIEIGERYSQIRAFHALLSDDG